MSWEVFEVPSILDGFEVVCIHVVPSFGGAHSMVGDECKCQPKIDRENGSFVITHNAYEHLEIIDQ